MAQAALYKYTKWQDTQQGYRYCRLSHAFLLAEDSVHVNMEEEEEYPIHLFHTLNGIMEQM